MADPKHNDIDIDDADQISALSLAWGVSTHRIRQAVREVGPKIVDVQRRLEDPTIHPNNIGRRLRRRWR
jgi:phosphoribosylanthranilate isomerase